MLHPRLWADVPPEDRLQCAELEQRPAHRSRCLAAVRPTGLGLPKGKYFRCLKSAEADGLCPSHRKVFARASRADGV